MKKAELQNLLALIPFLENNPGTSRAALAERLDCSEEEVTELLNRVLMCGSPPYLPDDYIGFALDGGGIRLNFASHFSRPIGLTLQEALSVLMLLGEVGIYARGAFADEAASLRAKLTAAVGGRDVEAVAEQLAVSAGAAVRSDILAALQSAGAERKAAEIDYYSLASDRTSRRRVRPYGLVENTGDLYLVAHCLERDAVLTFRVDRIKRLEVGDESFEIPDDFDLEAYRRDEMYMPGPRTERVRIRFTGPAADWVRESYDAGALADDSEGVELTLRSDTPEWVVHFCLKFGPDAELLEPESLRERIRSTITQIRSIYG